MTLFIVGVAMSTGVMKKIHKKKKKRKTLIHQQGREKIQSPGKFSSSPDVPSTYISDNAEGKLTDVFLLGLFCSLCFFP